MTFITKRRLVSLVSASAMVATLALAAAPAATLAAKPAPPSTLTSYSNGFEKTSDTIPGAKYATDNSKMHDVIRVASGENGIKAASGRFYATAAQDAFAFTKLGGYSSTFPTNGYTTSADFYVDVDSVGQFEWSSAINGTDGLHRRDFIFHAGRLAEGAFMVSVSNNSQRNGADGFNPVAITESGWYTFKHDFKNVGGTLSVDMRVTQKGATTPAGSWNLSDPSDLIGDTVGGNRYGWIVTNSFASLAIDNVTRISN